jgi:hypothetical protein
MAKQRVTATRSIAGFARVVIGLAVTAGWCATGNAATPARSQAPAVARAQAFPGRDDAYLITIVGQLNARDYTAQLRLLQNILGSLRQQKLRLAGEIAAKQRSLEACCALRTHAASCAMLRTNLAAFRVQHGAWLEAMDRRFAKGDNLSPTQLQNLADGVAPGGRAAMALAITVATEIAQLAAACAQP